MLFVTRAQWGARPYRLPGGAIQYASSKRRGVKLHYLGSAYSDRAHGLCDDYVRKIQADHMDRNGWSDIGYSFVVCTHGYVYEGRGLKRRNSANGNTTLNEQDYAVLLMVGSSGLTRPTTAQLHGGRDAIDYCRSSGPAGTWLGGHRDGYATACPGDPIYAWAKAGAPRPGGTVPPIVTSPEEDDMPLTDAEIDKIAVKVLTRDGVIANPLSPPSTNTHNSLATAVKNIEVVARRADTGVAALKTQVDAIGLLELTDAQVAQIATALAAHPTLIDQLADAFAAKVAARLAE